MGPQIGVITEQGDLGLGFDVLNEQDKNTIKQNNTANSEKDEKKDK